MTQAPLRLTENFPIWLLSAEVGHGALGMNGLLGYTAGTDDRVTPGPGDGKSAITLSAHAPSEILIHTEAPLKVSGFLNATAAAETGSPAYFVINDHPIGVVQRPYDSTDGMVIPAGHHCLRITCRQNSYRHTVWRFSLQQEPAARTRATPSLAVVTVACYPVAEAAEILWPLAESAQNSGHRLSVLGVGTEYRSHVNAKIRRLLDHVRHLDTSHILFTDAKDTLILGQAGEILAEFDRFGTDFLISMERACFPIHDRRWRNLFAGQVDHRNWPNSGGWIGTKSGAIRVLEKALALQQELIAGRPSGLANCWRHLLLPMHHDDQAMLQMLYLDGMIKGDVECRIFTNFGTADARIEGNQDYLIKDGRVHLKSTGATPSVLHFSGPACPRDRDPWAAWAREQRQATAPAYPDKDIAAIACPQA